jgi:hypothetical protein
MDPGETRLRSLAQKIAFVTPTAQVERFYQQLTDFLGKPSWATFYRDRSVNTINAVRNFMDISSRLCVRYDHILSPSILMVSLQHLTKT